MEILSVKKSVQSGLENPESRVIKNDKEGEDALNSEIVKRMRNTILYIKYSLYSADMSMKCFHGVRQR